MSLYGEYIKERENKDIFETDKGFITYLQLDESKTVCVYDFYIKKEHRSTGVAKELCDMVENVAKEKSYNYAMATIDLSTSNWEHSKNILEHYNFKPSKKDNTVIYFIKELNYGK